MTTEAKNQHFVPKGLLKNFTFEENKIWQIDKTTEKTSSPSLKGAANQNYFYNYEKHKKSLEIDFFGKIDNNAPIIISKIISDKTIKTLRGQEKKDLIKFVASQICRVPSVKRSLTELNEDFQNALGEKFSIVKEDILTDFLNSIIENTKIYEEMLKRKSLMLVDAGDDHNFIISDNPVIKVSLNFETGFNYGYNTLIADRDIFMLPISTRYLLMYFTSGFNYDIRRFAFTNNSYQFIYSDRFVYSNSEEILKNEIKEYYKKSYRYIESIRPDILQMDNIEFGQPLHIKSPRIVFEEKVKKEILEKYL